VLDCSATPRPCRPPCLRLCPLQVRILVAAAGLELMSLHRTRVGGYSLPPDLPLGGYV
jgi:hypothetical protein